MRTLLISPMWLDAENGVRRHEKWLDFIIPLKDKLGYDEIFFVDNASSNENFQKLKQKHPCIGNPRSLIKVHRCDVHIPRKAQNAYGYWYSALAIAAKYALDNNYHKILYLDTDMYPLTDRVCEYAKSLTSGWTGMWCPRHNFPETNFQIIGPDKLQEFHQHMSRDFLVYYPEGMAETCIPWTHVEKGFSGDRYGEMNNGLGIPQTKEMQYYGQCPITRELKFNVD